MAAATLATNLAAGHRDASPAARIHHDHHAAATDPLLLRASSLHHLCISRGATTISIFPATAAFTHHLLHGSSEREHPPRHHHLPPFARYRFRQPWQQLDSTTTNHRKASRDPAEAPQHHQQPHSSLHCCRS
ncbi:hypothetical protein DEO72_LG3g1251 [Vigna unguiculata]|uniref:Uncharacterized protein n=1 Tax=Vigna unguiculata TaxID=3917 RepID=A0A4D6LEH0_VIGUN|nr:hypothetical protein DEO72_LG3g1251 [Vigna unguiculata]